MTSAYRHSRRGLAVPFIILGLLLAAWTGWWFYLARQVETQLDLRTQALRDDGWTIRDQGRSVDGWPFRVRMEQVQADVLAPSGHGLAAPRLVAQANAWNPDRWVLIAPDGLTLTRPAKGQVAIAGDGLRLSVSHLTARVPDLRIQLSRPTFTARPGAEAFPIASAERVELYVRPHLINGQPAPDQTDLLFRLIDARGRPGGPVEGASRQGMLTAELETTLTRANALTGVDSGGIFANWTRSGGRFSAVRGQISAGDSKARISSDTLSARPDGRLQGRVALTAERPMEAIEGLARSGSGPVNRLGAAGAAAAAGAQRATTGERPVDLVIDFRDGRTWLGPFAIAPAPKLF